MPCVNVGTARPVYIPPELCEILPGQPFMGKLELRITSEMIKVACQSPDINAKLLEDEGPERLGFKSKALQKFNISIDPLLTVCPARILKPPVIEYAGPTVQPTTGDWTASYKMLRGATVPKWTVMHLAVGRDIIPQQSIRGIIGELRKQMTEIGLTHQQPFSEGQSGYFLATPNQLDAQFRELKRKDVKLVFVIIGPKSTKEHYAEIKKLGDTAHGITTVCCVGNSFLKIVGRGNMPANYMRNIALKINIKSGGINTRLRVDPRLKTLLDRDTMIVSALGVPQSNRLGSDLLLTQFLSRLDAM